MTNYNMPNTEQGTFTNANSSNTVNQISNYINGKIRQRILKMHALAIEYNIMLNWFLNIN